MKDRTKIYLPIPNREIQINIEVDEKGRVFVSGAEDVHVFFQKRSRGDIARGAFDIVPGHPTAEQNDTVVVCARAGLGGGALEVETGCNGYWRLNEGPRLTITPIHANHQFLLLAGVDNGAENQVQKLLPFIMSKDSTATI